MKASGHLLALALVVTLGLGACATDEFGNRRPMTDAEKGVLIGAASGAVLGAVAGKNRKKGAIIGAIGGGIAGGVVGNYMDNQKRDLEKALTNEAKSGAIQIDKLQNNMLRVTMTSQTAFDVDSASIKAGFQPAMNRIAEVVNRYGKTVLTVVGHTDSTGSAEYNQGLSERRAKSVETYFLNAGVNQLRLASYGRGLTEPRASNKTAEGRALNRRVEIFIEPVVAEEAGS